MWANASTSSSRWNHMRCLMCAGTWLNSSGNPLTKSKCTSLNNHPGDFVAGMVELESYTFPVQTIPGTIMESWCIYYQLPHMIAENIRNLLRE
ncbi:hypothetical protein TNCT_140081 [Trichonephila clavata]|uniref:Uncharacterized protein n=1 Tax=Trichonephila clavata TaxID=2740835 RepID=A0A8X6H7S0_TRICU|nr:hypothetical protein TNCT_140081 [Trichonephila clavata]